MFTCAMCGVDGQNGDMAVTDDEIANVARWMVDSSRIVVLTGAGISTDSGIPDFRGPNGVWTKNPLAEKTSTLSHYMNDPDVRKISWQNRLHSPNWTAEPNTGHRAVARLFDTGKVSSVVTQNIDGLHQKSGIPDDHVVEVHGTMHVCVCMTCGDKNPMQEVLKRVEAGEEDPSCLLCRGILKSDTISFGQSLVPEVIDRAFADAEASDMLIAVGTTLSVGPVNQVVPRAKATGSRVVIINAEPTVMDHYAHRVLVGQISDILPELVARM